MSRYYDNDGDPWAFQPYFSRVHFLGVPMGHIEVGGDPAEEVEVRHCWPVIFEGDDVPSDWDSERIGSLYYDQRGYIGHGLVLPGDVDHAHWALKYEVRDDGRIWVPAHVGSLHRFEEALGSLARWWFSTRRKVIAESRMETATMLDVVEWFEGRDR